jgi:CRP-like cAMP-binding protein
MIRNELEPIKAYIKSFAPVPDSEIEVFLKSIVFKKYKKGEFFCEYGKRTSEIGFVISGLFKVYYLTYDGRPFIRIFHAEGLPLADYAALIRGTVADVTIEALENSTIGIIPYKKFASFFESHASWQEFGRKIAEHFMIVRELREKQLLTLNASDRYEQFISEYRHYLNRISKQDAAAYIGITPVSLSRLTASRIKSKRQKNEC